MKKKRVLIVDDTPANIKVLTGLLKESCKIGFATNGEGAFSYVKIHHPDIILLDIMMPEIDGLEVCKTLKSNPATQKIPVIFITVLNKPEHIRQGFEAGAADFITKPFDGEEVLARIKTHLELSGYREELESLVEERTQALKKAEEELKQKAKRLEETNTALKVLLRNRDEEKKMLEESIVYNVNKLIKPWINKHRQTLITEKKDNYIDIIENNIDDIISPFVHTIANKLLNFTPAELQIANLIRQDKSTKEIADILNVSTHTIDSHRKHIREKLGLSNKKANLKIRLEALNSSK